MNKLATLDYIVFFIYFIIVAGYGFYIYKKKKVESVSSKDYFLAEGSLTWWAIGASLIASNISAEQFIGMSGSGFQIGLAISAYEWMAAVTLIIIAVFFMPVYLKNKIFTMPQFLNQRYGKKVATIMAVFWLLLYVVVNLTSILFLGALAMNSISGINFNLCMGILAIFAVFIALGGMKVIGFTDVIQVFFLILGGLATTYLALQLIGDKFGLHGIAESFHFMENQAQDHFQMIVSPENPNYLDVPGLAMLVGGLWIVNLNYWGCNQYITQRALGADLKTARSGLLFAGFLKILMPLIVVIPGIAAYVLYKHGMFQTEMLQNGELNPDRSYPVLLNLLPAGLKGVAFAALTAAIVASLAGKANSISTIFTLDIYKKSINPEANEKNLVLVGKITVVIAMILGIIISPHLGIDKKGGFQYIQEYTGFVSPGILAMFLLGFFWKKATQPAALFAIIAGFILSCLLKIAPEHMDLSFLASSHWAAKNAKGVYEIPFLDRMSIVFTFCIVSMIIISLVAPRKVKNENEIIVDTRMFKVTPSYAIGALITLGIVAALYIAYW